jgi:prefoldin subunit 5
MAAALERERLEEYHTLLQDKLLPMQAERREKLQKLDAQVLEWKDLCDRLDTFTQHLAESARLAAAAEPLAARKPMKLEVDVGQGFHMHARVAAEDMESKLVINVGADVFVEMSIVEATTFSCKKLEMLQRSLAQARDDLLAVNTDVTMARTALLALDPAAATRFS